MKISILTPDLSNNCLGRAYFLAKMLQRRYEAEIVGPVFGDGIWKPVADDNSINFKAVKMCKGLKPYKQAFDLIKKIDGDVIYASKPLFTSFGVGLVIKKLKKKPLILDVDDWQMGFIKEQYKNLSAFSCAQSLVSSALLLYKLNSFWNNLIFERLIFSADETIVSNTFLKDKFGGTLIWHGRDTQAFNPEKHNKNQMKKKYNISENKHIVMFLGTPQPYKGLEDLIQSVHMLKNRDIILVVVGINFNSQYSSNLVNSAKKLLNSNFLGFGLQPFEAIPEFLTMADVVVIPQKKNYATIGQIPAKVFDAMAMAKPIIATAVSDLPEILGDCGWIADSDSPEQLSKYIQYVLENPYEADEMGRKAREKCIEHYSWDSMESKLLNIFRKYE